MHRGHEHLLFDEVQHVFVDQRRGAVGAHAASVRAGVAIVSPFVILGRRQCENRAAVGDRQHAGFLAVEAFFDDDLVAGLAELLVAADASDGLDGFGARGADEHAFAGSEAVGLHHHRHVFAVLEKRGGVVGVAKHLVVGGRHVGMAQQVFAKDLAPLELGGVGTRAKDAQLGVGEGVDDAFGERQLGPDDRERDVVLRGELDQAGEVGGRDVDVLGVDRRARVSGGDENALDARALRELPSQRVFASAVANHQHVHQSVLR